MNRAAGHRTGRRDSFETRSVAMFGVEYKDNVYGKK
jgi:hypothetical protein